MIVLRDEKLVGPGDRLCVSHDYSATVRAKLSGSRHELVKFVCQDDLECALVFEVRGGDLVPVDVQPRTHVKHKPVPEQKSPGACEVIHPSAAGTVV